MAIKSKKSNERFALKLTLFLVFVLSVGIAASAMFSALSRMSNQDFDMYDVLSAERYVETNAYMYEVQNAVSNLTYDVSQLLLQNGIDMQNNMYNDEYDIFTEEQQAVLYELSEFEDLPKMIEKGLYGRYDFLYSINIDGITITNSENIESNKVFYCFFENGMRYGVDSDEYIGNYYYISYLNLGNKGSITIAYDDSYITAKQTEWESLRANFIYCVVIAGAMAVTALISLIWYLCVVGKCSNGELIKPKGVMAVPLGIQLIISAVVFTGLLIFIAFLFDIQWYLSRRAEKLIIDLDILSMGAAAVSGGTAAAVLLWILGSWVSRLRCKKFWRCTLIYMLFAKLRNISVSVLSSKGFAEKALKKYFIASRTAIFTAAIISVMIMAGGIRSYNHPTAFLGFILLVLTSAAYICMSVYEAKGFGEIDRAIDDVYNGRQPMFGENMFKPPFSYLSRKLGSISSGYMKSVEERVKSERMKIELVTNVSHDLKTPLTSIISYVDLLGKVEDLPPEAKDYVAILAKKSDRLKNIVTDVFELAKTTSGEIQVEHEKIELNKLIIQTVADMGDSIEKSGLTVKTSVLDEPVCIISDGKKLYRVIQNLIDNALKYSLKGTRIFISLTTDDYYAVIRVINTAGYEMQFTKEEILERFARGDKARTTEGSGLGLSIAQGMTSACGGIFDIEIDGDQFKAVMKFPKMK